MYPEVKRQREVCSIKGKETLEAIGTSSVSLQVRARCQHLPVKEETLQRVGLYIETIIGSLPEDLQAVLHHH